MRRLNLLFALGWLAFSQQDWAAECKPMQRDHEPRQDASWSGPEAPLGNPCVMETDQVGVSVVLDEHLLTSSGRDSDYNGGGEITFSGSKAIRWGRWLDGLLGFIDQGLGIGESESGSLRQPSHALAAGLLIFTPRDLQSHEVVVGDRPYASLFFLSSGRQYAVSDSNVAYNSSLTIGFLGLAAAESVQRALHDITGSTQPEGWSHQISSGGEPTARFNVARQSLIGEYRGAKWDVDGKWTVAGSIGTVTEATVGANFRWGHIRSPWWAVAPEQSTYVQETLPAPPRLSGDSEFFLLIGTRFKLRAYNAFLEGQFRESDLRYSSASLNRSLGEAWTGFEFRTNSGWAVRYLARWESAELRSGIGSRSITWGSLEIAKSLGP
jgi:hypothetical protein